MDIWKATAKIDTVSLPASDGNRWNGTCTVPAFYLAEAGITSRAQAEKRAAEIVDPLHMTGAKVTVRRVTGLRKDLRTAVKALRNAQGRETDGTDAEHEALYMLAESVAHLLGRDWGRLISGREEA